jgi:hypothetical protein
MSAFVGDDESAGRQTDGSRLYAIVYISTAARPLSMPELERLRDRAQARNLREHVTGVLLYSDGAFMQYLEGPAAGLARVYSAIKADPMHYGVIDLLREPVQAREFAGWAMALRAVDAGGTATSARPDDLLCGDAGAPACTHSTARELLLSFWAKGRHAAASTLLDFSTERARRVGDAPAT